MVGGPPAAHEPNRLGGLALRGGAVTLVGQSVRFLAQLGAMAVMARVLDPADYGLFALAMAVVAFALLFSDLGLSAAAVQARELSPDLASTLFWMSLGLGLVLALALLAAAPWVSILFGDARVGAMVAALAGLLILAGMAGQHTAALQRAMRFRVLALASAVGSACGAALGVAAALLGAGCWALVAMAYGAPLVSLGILWVASPLRPRGPRKGAGARRMLRFGGYYAGFNVVNFFARKADDLLIGWAHGATPLGLYNRAYQLLGLPMNQLNAPASSVVVPALSRLQDAPEEYRRLYRGAMGLVLAIGFPIVGFLLARAEDVVLLVFGPKWAEAVPIFRALALATVVSTANMAVGWVYVSLGNTRRMFHWSLVSVPIFVLSFVVGLPHGPVGVAWSYSVASVAIWFAAIPFGFRSTFMRLADPLSAAWRPLLASGVAGIILTLTQGATDACTPLFARVLLAGLVYTLPYFVTWCLLPGGRSMVRATLRLVARSVSRPASSSPESN